MKKKLFTVTLCLAAVCALAACGKSKDSSEATTAMELSTEDYAEDYPVTTPVEVDAAEYVELGEYKNLTVTAEKTEITDEDVEEEIENFVEGYAEYQEITDRDTVQEGDYVNIDYTCTIGGKANEEYSDTDIDVKAEDGELDSYLGVGLNDDFDLESKVIGAKVGSTVTEEFTFPDDYDDEAVAGKKCKMDVKINAISKEVFPELNDAFVKENTDSSTVEEYREEVRQTLEEQAAAEAEESGQESVWNQILENATLKKPFTDDMINQQIENIKIENQEFVEYLDMDLEDYLTEATGMTLEELASESLKSQCVQDLLIEAEKITVTDEEVQEEMEAIADESGMGSVEEVEEIYSKDDIRQQLLSNKLFEKLMDVNTVKTVPAAAEADDAEGEVEVEMED